MKESRYYFVYTDGGVSEALNKGRSGFVIVFKDNLIYEDVVDINCSGGFDVERAESQALLMACEYCEFHPGNYILYTDSRSILDKIQGKVPNATKNPHVSGIISIMEKINSSVLPVSITLKYKKRRSDKWMKFVDDLVNLKKS